MPTGDVAVTGPGRLRCKHIIHAVGPIWNSSKSDKYNINLLSSAVMNTLIKANKIECKSVSIPAISSGRYGFPKPLCAKVFYANLKRFVRAVKQQNATLKLKTVRLTNFDNETC